MIIKTFEIINIVGVMYDLFYNKFSDLKTTSFKAKNKIETILD